MAFYQRFYASHTKLTLLLPSERSLPHLLRTIVLPSDLKPTKEMALLLWH